MKTAIPPEIPPATSSQLTRVLLSINQVAMGTGLSRSYIYLLISRGRLRAHKCGTRTIIFSSDLDTFLQDLPRLHVRGAA
jgi:excisionase family DNA binding protein